ncbi:MAG: glycosyltransferase family 4 protein [Patescibacteria group bacterium]|nr:glycosyltransferase family 4 protein [Patescibacteria group bacterium]
MSLKIAQVAPLWENVPPEKYGGTERVVYYLTEGLVKRGYEVTLFSAGTSKTSAKLVSIYPRPLVKDKIPWSNLMYPLLHITSVFDRQEEFDIIHVHLNKSSDYISLPLARPIKEKVVFTLHFPYPLSHGRQDRHLVLQKYKDLNYVSISNSQRKGGENLNWLATVYNGVDINLYKFNPNPTGDYFLWLGKFNPDKGVKEAIIAAKRAGVKLLVAGTIDTLDNQNFQYYKNEIEPLLDNKQVIYIGELNDEEKNRVYGNALGFLNPIKWNEPFGLVMAEAMATGTPVIAFKNGAATEIIVDGNSGFLVNSIEEIIEKMTLIQNINRRECRKRIEEHFTTDRMVDEYCKIYHILKSKK